MSASTNPGTYPGNPALPREVKEKILSTFRHTLNLFHEGKIDDCVIGCDFILKMDARFAPARQLLEKAKNPNANVDVSQLEAIVASTPTRQERVVAADPDRLLVRAVESYNARDFDAAIAAAEQVLHVLPGNQDALEILDKSERKKAAQPVFDGSRQRALAALAADRKEDARKELDQMKSLDPDHPAVALLERRIGPAPAAPPPQTARAVPPPPPDFGGLSLDSPADGGHFGSTSEPEIHFDDGATVALRIPPPPPPPAAPGGHAAGGPPSDLGGGGLDSLSLDSLSLDAPPPMPEIRPQAPERAQLGGPLAGSYTPPSPPPPPAFLSPEPPEPVLAKGSPADMWSDSGGNLDLDDVHDLPQDTGSSSAPPVAIGGLEAEDSGQSSDDEIASLLRQGDDAVRRGERQQAIEIWSRIFLIDINNSEAVTRIERTRQEMTEGNRKVSDGLKTGREMYEAGDLSGARELFLQVLAVDENEPTARFYLDRIQEEIANPGSTAAPASAPTPSAPLDFEDAMPAAAPRTAAGAAGKPAGRSVRLKVPSRAILLVAGFVVMAGVLVYFFVLRQPRPGGAASTTASKGGPAGAASLAQARELLGAGKITEAKQELKRIKPSSPDFAEAQRMLGDLGKSGGVTVETAPSDTSATSTALETPVSAADAQAARLRSAGETALSQKRYIDAMKSFSQAAIAFKNDPTFAQSMGVAAEKVAALTPAVKLYNEGEYETAIPVLWRI
jgi:tetratricopeptide (TPR) repeat protein